MTNTLAIETSGEICSVGLNVDGNRFVVSEHVQKKHNERLLPMLTELREAAGLSQSALLDCLGAVAFGCGPGSFTGVRIAAAAAQAVALAAGATMIRVSSSAAMASCAFHALSEVSGVITAIRSRRDLYYLAAYSTLDGELRCLSADRLCESAPDGEFAGLYSDWPLVGATPEWWTGERSIPVSVDAHALLEVAEVMLRNGEMVDVAAGLPEYFSGDTPWRKSR
jgi:tRNA threonylcarbamoyladenosine biosynthesis protein TsaB